MRHLSLRVLSIIGCGKDAYRLFALVPGAFDFTFPVLSLHYVSSR